MRLIKKAKLDFNVWKITFINIRITFSPKSYRKWAKNYFQENWTLTNWNLKTLFHIIPFFYGVSNMIWSRYYDQTIPYIFGITIPGTKIINEEISWETFEFIKSKDINIKKINKIDFYNNCCFVQYINQNDDLFVGLILSNSDIKSLKIGLPSYKIAVGNYLSFVSKNKLSKETFFSKNQNLYYQLDELPLKLEGIINTEFQEQKEEIFSTKLKNIVEKEKNQKVKSKLKIRKNKITTKISIPTEFLITNKMGETNAVKLPNQTNLKRQIDFPSKSQNTSFFEKKQLIQKELDFLFFNQGILPNSFLNNYDIEKKSKKNLIEDTKLGLKNSNLFSFMDYSSTETLELINSFLQLKKTNVYFPRKVSGYRYPDLSREDVYSFKLNSLFKINEDTNLLKISLPTNLLTALKDNSLLESNLCGPLTITQRKDNFLENTLEETKVNEKDVLNWKKIILQETLKKQNKTFEDFDDSDPDSWFLSFKDKEKRKSINFEEDHFLDLLKQNIKTENLYNQNKLFNQIENQKLIYHFIPFSESFLTEKTPNTIKVGDLYKRTSTLSTFLDKKVSSFQKINFNFFESWEPISSNSWLIITQFSIGLFLLQLLKDLYKDYGKELVEYILQFASSSGIDVEEIKEQYLYDDPGYRLIRKINKSFKDIAGIDNILSQLGEVVWFLRNNGRSSKFKNSIPNGILLTGPPGTGKTLLVQAIAGEAQVPIIVESGSLLSDPQQKGRGVERLKKIFDQARQLAPCIIFIDEVDTLGEKRQNIIQTAMGGDELIESIYENNLIKSNDVKTEINSLQNNEFLPKPLNLNEDTRIEKDLEYQLFRGESENKLNIGNNQFQQNIESKKTRLNLLTQFLVEMDGLKERQGVIVIGATNRPNVLDPALIRPGRFDKIINLELPGKQKRIEILKLYGNKLQTENTISWEYLANRTRGFSAADLAAAMNESTIQSIIKKTNHTIETIERGIDLVTSYNFDNTNFSTKKISKDPFFLSRLAYYQAGKAVLQSILQNHPPLVVLHLWPRPKNARHTRLSQNSFLENTNRLTLESQLIGLYAGKASEMITLYGNRINTSLKRWHSDLGLEELLSATFLANLLVEKWYFYSTQVLIRKTNKILTNRNEKAFTDLEKLELSKILDNELEDELEVEKIAKLSRTGRYQQRGFGPWWQIQVAKQTSEIESFFADWYRIYLPDPEETILNLEWIPPDEYHHSNDSLKKLSEKSNTSYNDLYKIERDYIFHGLTLNAFNKAFSSLEEKREFLDYFADYLLRFEILRENTISVVLKNKNQTKSLDYENFIKRKEDCINNYKIIENFWGINSRRKKYRFLNIETLNFLQNYSNYESPFFNFNETTKKT